MCFHDLPGVQDANRIAQLLKDRAVWAALGIAVMLNTGKDHPIFL